MGVASARKIRKSFTIDDVYALPEGQRAELIDGDLYMMASPGRTHQELVKEFTYLIESYIRGKGGECKVYPAPFAVFLNEDDKTYLEPDISVICDKNKLTKEGCMGAKLIFQSWNLSEGQREGIWGGEFDSRPFSYVFVRKS